MSVCSRSKTKMLILGIDSSSVSGAAAVLRDNTVLADGFVCNGLTQSQTLLPLIQQTLQQADVQPDAIDLIAVTNGPGSFTGLRIGMATAKGIAAVYDTPCVGVSALEAAAMGVRQNGAVICPVMDARCKQVYNALFCCQDGKLSRLCEDRAISIEDLKKELENLKKPVVLVGDGAVLCYNAYKDLDHVALCAEKDRLIRGESVALLGFANTDAAVQPEALRPVYLRLPQAQRELLKKKGQNEQ